jgi:hypothetical protein
MWKQRSAELHKWLKTTPPASIGAKLFLQTRFGVRSASPFVPGQNFGLAFDEAQMIGPRLNQEPRADCTGVQIQTRN